VISDFELSIGSSFGLRIINRLGCQSSCANGCAARQGFPQLEASAYAESVNRAAPKRAAARNVSYSLPDNRAGAVDAAGGKIGVEK
jgi:hypothetical protein